MTALPHRKNPFRSWMKTIAILVFIALLASCTYRHYLGLHGPSIKKHPQVHGEVKADQACLKCHGPGPSDAPKTNHPDFKGCLKCHNDDLPG